jgi:thiol-disulfide isomerase/thioredoxin
VGEWLQAHAAHLAAWVRVGALVTAGVGTAGLLYLWRSPAARTWHPRFRNKARLAFQNLLGLAIAALAVAYGPMTPLFGTARILDNTVGSPVPDLEFRSVQDGAARRLSELRGSVVVVNLWATWCPPCLRELPVLNRLQGSYRERGVVVLTLTDQGADEVRDVLSRLAPQPMNGTVESFGWLAIRDFRPFTLVLDRQGVLRDYLFGDQTYDAFAARIQPYL